MIQRGDVVGSIRRLSCSTKSLKGLKDLWVRARRISHMPSPPCGFKTHTPLSKSWKCTSGKTVPHKVVPEENHAD